MLIQRGYDGSDINICCKECGGNLVVNENKFLYNGGMFVYAHDIYCDKCGNRTPLFKYRKDALRYYMKEYGIIRDDTN